MPTYLADILNQLKSIWARLDGGQRLTIAVVLAATAVGFGGLVWYAQQPDYVVVSSKVENFGAASAALEAANIQIKNDGVQVLVPRKDFDRANRVLEAEGVRTNGGAGRGFLDSLTATAEGNRQRNWASLVTLVEAKIARSRQIQFVQILSSRPKQQQFVQDEDRSRATVMITLVPGSDFGSAARFALDAAASGLEIPREKVTVHDAKGDRVFTYKEHGGGGSTDGRDFLRLQAMWQRNLTSKVENALYMVFQDDVKVTVNLTLRPTTEFKTGVNLPPEGLPPNEVETTKKDMTSGKSTSSATPANAPATGANGTSTGGLTSNTNDKTEKKITDKALYGVLTIAQLAPFIDRITVAVIANEKSDAGKKLDEIKTVVKHAVGLVEGRDEIEAVALPFADPPPPPEPPGVDLMAMAEKFAPAVGQVLAVLLVIFFLRGMMKKAQTKRVAPVAARPTVETSTEDDSPDEVARRMRRDIEKAIEDDPAAISRMLDNWLTEKQA